MNPISQQLLLRNEFPVLLTMLFGGLGAILAYLGTQVQSVPWLEYKQVPSSDPNTHNFEFVSLNRPMNRVEILFSSTPDESEIKLTAKVNPASGTYFTSEPDDVKGGAGYCYVRLPKLPSGQPLGIELKSVSPLSLPLDVALSIRDAGDIAATDIILRESSLLTLLARYYLETLMWLALVFVITLLFYISYILGFWTRRKGFAVEFQTNPDVSNVEPQSKIDS